MSLDVTRIMPAIPLGNDASVIILPSQAHMEIRAKGKLRAAIENEAVCQKQYGRDMTKKIMMGG
jgi:hypothetical protein